LGKTWASAYEIAFHLTGLYPDWWDGYRWSRGVTGWAMGNSQEATRDTMQRLILGRPGEWGTGTVPKNTFLGDPKRAGGAVSDAVDMLTVRHVSGGVSRLYFKSYEKKREKLQGETLDFVAMDEEPPIDIYMECLTRTNATGGIVWITFTPLLGMSDVVGMFIPAPTSSERADICMTIYDVGHYTAEERERIVASYPAWERDARTMGVPSLGSGRVFPIAEDAIKCKPFDFPPYFKHICGIDFGWDHPTACAWIAIDREADIYYVYDVLKQRETTPDEIAPQILERGDWIPVAYPHDGLQHEKGSGIQLAQLYRDAGCNLLHEIAQFEATGDEEGRKTSRVSVEAGVVGMLDLMKAGKFKVFENLEDWFSEFRLYHRKDGKIVKLGDDLMSATRYAYMMNRYADSPRPVIHSRRKRRYDWRVG
jgi:phage terminase large subunit-like protein